MSRARRLPRRRPVPLIAWIGLPAAAAVAAVGVVAPGGSGSSQRAPDAAAPDVRLVEPAGRTERPPAGGATGIATSTQTSVSTPSSGTATTAGRAAASAAPTPAASTASATTAAEHGQHGTHPTHPAHPTHKPR